MVLPSSGGPQRPHERRAGGITKARPSDNTRVHVGRKLSIPPSHCGIAEEGLGRTATVVRFENLRCCVRFVTGETAWFNNSAVRDWLQPDVDDGLRELLSSCSFAATTDIGASAAAAAAPARQPMAQEEAGDMLEAADEGLERFEALGLLDDDDERPPFTVVVRAGPTHPPASGVRWVSSSNLVAGLPGSCSPVQTAIERVFDRPPFCAQCGFSHWAFGPKWAYGPKWSSASGP